MRLLSCDIANFGNLSNYHMDFTSGANTILEHNGWGKSTMAAFVRAMFYGLDGTRKRELSENDRIKYQPWNGGRFGGELSFEVGGKSYTIIREFGMKDKDVSFTLLDAVTKLPSSDYTEKIGEELFGVDSESYQRTSFIDHNAIKYVGVNSTVGAKVSSLSESGDLENYDAAFNAMKSYLDKKAPNKKLGELSKRKSVIKELEVEIKKAPSLEQKVNELKNNREAVKAEADAIQTQIKGNRDKLKALGESKTRLAKKNQLDQMKNDVTERRRSVDEILAGFGEEVPERGQLENALEKLSELEKLEGRLGASSDTYDQEKLDRLGAFFEAGVPEDIELDEKISLCNSVQNLNQTNATFEELIVRENERLETLRIAAKEAEAKQAAASKQADERKTKKIIGAALIAVGVTLALILAAILKMLAAGIAVGAAFIIVGLIVIMLAGNEGKNVDFDPSIYQADDSHLKELRENINTNNQKIKEAEDEIRSYLATYGQSYSRLDAEKLLYEIKNKAAEYRELQQKKKLSAASNESLVKEYEEKKAAAHTLLQSISVKSVAISGDGNINYKGARDEISKLAQMLTEYEAGVRELENAEKRAQKFIEENPELDDIQDEGQLQSADSSVIEAQLEQEYSDLSESLSKKQEYISQYDRQLEDAYDELDAIVQDRQRLAELKDEFDEMSARYEVISQTQEYLKQAKEQFIAKFMSPVKNAFDKYYSIMVDGKEDPSKVFQIDANLNITRKEDGFPHPIEAESDGYGDMIGLCIRMALLDVMYEKEKPMVIMDDPFSNLDGEKLANARTFISEVEKDYQILYMTCHESRA